MPDKKLTINVNEKLHTAIEEVSNDLGITATELIRRSLGLVATMHGIMKEQNAVDGYFCTKDNEGNLVQQHVVSGMLY